MDDGVGAGGVIADHAAEVGAARGGDFGAELQTVRSESTVELIENNAGLHAGDLQVRVDVEDVVEILAAIENDAGADRLPREAGAAAARDDGDVHLQGDLHGGLQGRCGFWDDDADRLDLVNACVSGVKPTRDRIESHLAIDMAAQVVEQGSVLLCGEIHGGLQFSPRFTRQLIAFILRRIPMEDDTCESLPVPLQMAENVHRADDPNEDAGVIDDEQAVHAQANHVVDDALHGRVGSDREDCRRHQLGHGALGAPLVLRGVSSSANVGAKKKSGSPAGCFSCSH